MNYSLITTIIRCFSILLLCAALQTNATADEASSQASDAYLQAYQKAVEIKNQANSLLQAVQRIIDAVNNIFEHVGNTAKIDTDTITKIVGADAMTTTWGAKITVEGDNRTITLHFSTAPAADVCEVLVRKLRSNPNFTIKAPCTGMIINEQ